MYVTLEHSFLGIGKALKLEARSIEKFSIFYCR
jgi:hypothetical protein